MDVDIACVGFGPAMGGFLTTLARQLAARGRHARWSKARPCPACRSRSSATSAPTTSASASRGVVTRARGIRASFPELDPPQIPMAAPVAKEKVLYLLDPIGASRRSLRVARRRSPHQRLQVAS